MNGHDYPELFAPPDDYPGDDDDCMDDYDMDAPECPFDCRSELVRHGDGWYCEDCDVPFDSAAEVERIRNQSPERDDDRDEPATWWVGSFGLGGGMW